jgi:predicted NACHT family NTPase
MQRGRCIFLFDGLDEVERPLYRKCTEQLHDFQQHYRDNRFVVACRSASYTGDFEGSTLCEIADLDRSSAYRLIRAYFGTETGNAGDLIGELENNRSALDLTRSPLLATMLCIQYDLGYTIPKRRNSLYAELLDTLMFKWDVQKRVRRASRHPSVGRQTIKRILSRIARRTFEAHAVYFQRRNVLRWVAEELCMLGGSSVEASDLLEDIERNTGLVVERAAGVLSVAHTTFQEYLSAVAYVEERLEHEVAEHHLYDRRYGDIIVMIAESLPNADAFIRHIVGKVVRELVQQGIESDEVWEVLTRLGRAEVAMARQLRGLLADVAVDVLAADVE